jgi:diguanylate cyclase (GGDEF)-like protein
MHLPTPSLPPGQPDPAWLRRFFYVQRTCLALVQLISFAALAAWLFPRLNEYLPVAITDMGAPMAVIAMFCAFSLVMSEAGNPLLILSLGRYVAAIPALLATAILAAGLFFPAYVPEIFLSGGRAFSTGGSLSSQSAIAFLFLSIVMILVRTDGAISRRAADVLVSALFLLTLILISQDLFGTLGLFGLKASDLISPQVVFCLVLLTIVVVLRQGEHGVYSIFLGAGIGSRIARGFAPILLLWPFLREIGESQLGLQQLIPARFTTSILTSLGVAASLVLLMLIVWRINDMEKEIHDLTLRDELTGLYNMRGFYLLGEQTLRLAQRAQLPFSVLFLDLDGLKQVNDRMGHNTGSTYLSETGELLVSNFRDADVKGRFGGDEFVVAGQFSRVGIEIAALRLKTAAQELSSGAGRRYPLSFSIGHVTSEYYSTETLKELVTRADHAMYEEKRRRKVSRT